MCNSDGTSKVVAPAILGASLTMVAILIGVAGILVGVIKQAGNLTELVRLERILLWGVVVLIGLNAWCVSWSVRAVTKNDVCHALFVAPMWIQTWVIFVGLLIWAGFV